MNEDKNTWILDLPLTKQGSSLAVCIPAKVIKQLNLKRGSRIRLLLRNEDDDHA